MGVKCVWVCDVCSASAEARMDGGLFACDSFDSFRSLGYSNLCEKCHRRLIITIRRAVEEIKEERNGD